ncbi:MAG: class I SAM-dependent methyltransferase [Candidatus Rokubacteria bacterium]|nr:class I SAM-dependent methyltransferase [Candidatus Rokubacteria bacterium]
MTRKGLYSNPQYYEVAFDLNRKPEVDFLEGCFKRYSGRPVRRVLDIACGTGPHLLRLARRGYQMAGLDLSRDNIAYVRARANALRLEVSLHVQDMTRFALPAPMDAAICMQDSQGHLLTNADILRHFRAVARALRPGGLYIFDRFIPSSWTNPARRWSWTRRRGRLTVRATFAALEAVNPVTQVFREDMSFEVVENGTVRHYHQHHLSRMVFPQELKALVALAGGLEFVEWFYGFKPHQLLHRARHPLMMIVVLRKQ